MIESLQTTKRALFRFATLSEFLEGREGGGDEVQKVFVQGKIAWNHL